MGTATLAPAPTGERPRAKVINDDGRTCTKCREFLPWDAFGPYAKGPRGRAPQCRDCTNRRKRLTERMASDPESAPSVARAVDSAPDPAPAIRLREELERQRARGRPWRSAWALALSEAVRGLPPQDAATWRWAFNGTREAWKAAYNGESTSRVMFVPDDERVAA